MEVDFRMHKDYCKGDAGNYETFCINGVNMDREATFCVDSTHDMNPFCVDTPETLLDPAWTAQRNYIEQYITDTEAALFGDNFADPDTGYLGSVQRSFPALTEALKLQERAAKVGFDWKDTTQIFDKLSSINHHDFSFLLLSW